MQDMKISEEQMKAMAAKGMASYLIQSFVLTFISTTGLAILIQMHTPSTALKGAIYGAFVGLVLVGSRMLNGGLWENRPLRLRAITVGHEVALFAVQGVALTLWR
jgi:hypothetical protein